MLARERKQKQQIPDGIGGHAEQQQQQQPIPTKSVHSYENVSNISLMTISIPIVLVLLNWYFSLFQLEERDIVINGQQAEELDMKSEEEDASANEAFKKMFESKGFSFEITNIPGKSIVACS